jgi:hypothetical protein
MNFYFWLTLVFKILKYKQINKNTKIKLLILKLKLVLALIFYRFGLET